MSGPTKKTAAAAIAYRRGYIWRHNSYLGHVTMMRIQALAIYDSPSATPEAQQLALEIVTLTRHLQAALRTRIGPETPE
jgi:hypothetical protein